MSDPSPPIDPSDPASSGLRKVLNRHGYGFQYRALKECLRDQGYRSWRLAVAEYPVELHGVSTHIDFVLGLDSHLVVAECKRIDGWTWGFARGLVPHQAISEQPRADFLYWKDNRDALYRRPRTIGYWHAPPYDTAVELKQRGETDKSPKALDSAVAQVFRGRGGLMNDLQSRGALRYGGGAVVPMILTTAGLVVTQTNLSQADLETGDLGQIDAESVPYVWYDHNLSASLRPDVPRDEADSGAPTKTEALQKSLAHDMSRSVAIVTPAGIPQFLAYLSQCLFLGGDPI